MSGSPAGKRFNPVQNNTEANGNDVMAELQALLKGRRTATDRVLGSPRAQRKAAAGKSTSVSEKRLYSTEKVATELREAERASSQSPSSNTKWHIPPPSPAAPTKKPIQPPLKPVASPIPIPGAGTSLVPDPGLHGDYVAAESPRGQSRAAAFITSVDVAVGMSVTNNNQPPSNSDGTKAALTQSLPKSNLNRVGPPPNAPPPRLLQQGTSVPTATSTATGAGASAIPSSSNQTSGNGTRKVSGGSSFPPKLTHKTSNITFNEPVKVTKKGGGKKAPLVTSKSSSSVGIKRLLFKKKGNKKDSSEQISTTTTNLKKAKSEQKLSIRPLSPEGDQMSGSESDTNTPKAPALSSVTASTSTPSFAYQNIFDDEAFMTRNQHRFEDAHIDKKPMPLPRKNSLSNAAVQSTTLRSGIRSYQKSSLNATALTEEEGSSSLDSGTDSPTLGRERERKRDSDSSQLCFVIGSPPPSSSITAGIMSAERRPASPLSVRSPPATSSPISILSPTAKGNIPISSRTVISPEPKKQRSTEAFMPVANKDSAADLISDFSKFPLFQPDPAMSTSKRRVMARSNPSISTINQEAMNTGKRLPGSVPMRRRSTPREVRRAVMSDSTQLDLEDGNEEYIPMNPIRHAASMNLLDVSHEETFPMDPRASGYYLKILAPDGKTAKNKETEPMSDEYLSSPDSYNEVNLGKIVTVPVRESVKSPEDEYISIRGHCSNSIMRDQSNETSIDANKDHSIPQSPSKARCGECKESAEKGQKPAQSRFQIGREGRKGIKYSDVTIAPVGSQGNVIKRKRSAPKKFSYQLVQIEHGKQSTIQDPEGTRDSQRVSDKQGQRRESEPGVSPIATKEERKISAPASVFSPQQSASKVEAAGMYREKDRGSLSRLADRPLPKVPEFEQEKIDSLHLRKQESLEDTDDSVEEDDEKLYYVTTSSFVGRSEKAEASPVSVAIPGQVPAGRVVWHEYVEIDEEEIGKMGAALPPLPGQLLRLMPSLRNSTQGMDATGPMWHVEPVTAGSDNSINSDGTEWRVDRSDSLESCPYIEPTHVGSPPVVPDRPDNLDEFIQRKAVASGEYSYAAVSSQNFGVKWMRFHSSNPRHITLAPVNASNNQNEAFILAPDSRFAGDRGTSSEKQKPDGKKQKSKMSDSPRGNQEGFYPPLLPPKSASLLREQKLTSSGRPQSYLIPVITTKKRGKPTNIERDKSNSTGQLSVSRDAATGERMESHHKGDSSKRKRVPPPKPKPYKDAQITKQRYEGQPKEMKVVIVDENHLLYNPENTERSKSSLGFKSTAERNKSISRRMDLSPSDAIGSRSRLMREKSQSTGSVLEASFSSDFDSRDKWIEKETPILKAEKTSRKSGKTEKNVPSGPRMTHNNERRSGQHRKESVAHGPLRSDAVRRRHKTSKGSPGVESGTQDSAKGEENSSLAVLRKNKETIVKHLSRALDMEKLDLEFGPNEAEVESDRNVHEKESPSDSGRGLSDILSELDLLLKNNVFSTEDLLKAIQSRLKIKVNLHEESTQPDRSGKQSNKETAFYHTPQDGEEGPLYQASHDTSKESENKGTTETADNDTQSSARSDGTAFYVNDEVLLNLKGLRMITYSPEYVNTKYASEDQSGDSASNSQSSDQSSSASDLTSYDSPHKWTNSAMQMQSDSASETQAKLTSPVSGSPKAFTKTDVTPAHEGASSMKEKSKGKVPLQPPIRMRSQSSIDVSPKSRRKNQSNSQSEASELDSSAHGYQLALRMEDERMFSTHKKSSTVPVKESTSSSKSSRRSTPAPSSSSMGQPSSSVSKLSWPNSEGRLTSGQSHFDSLFTTQGNTSSETASAILTSSQQRTPSTTSTVSSVAHPPRDEEQLTASQKIRHHYQNLFGSDDSSSVGLLQCVSMRESRCFSTGSKPFVRVDTERRSTNIENTPIAGGGSTFTNGVGVFTHKGGVLMNAGSGVVIEVPEDAVPRGKKQKLWFEVKQDVINLLHEDSHDSSHSLTDSFQFNMGSAEFENYLARKRERKVQLSPMILIGPSDAVLSRPIKIKMPHCLPYRNNSWHLHMFARAENAETEEWTELSNTIGLIDLPPRRAGNRSYEKSSYQMHIDYTQVRDCVTMTSA